MKHFLVTEWNVDMTDLAWLKERQVLFEKFTLPSVQAQTCKDFEWILVSDERTPDEFKKVLESYPATVMYHDFRNYKWGAPKQESDIMQRSVDLEYIKGALVEFLSCRLLYQEDYVITSRLDNDDAISKDHIEKIQQYAAKHYDTEHNSFWLSLVRGYKWCDGNVYPKNSNNNPFISFVDIYTNNLQTTYQTCHTEASKTRYPVVAIREGQPTWLQVIHGGNLLNKLMRFKGKRQDKEIKDRFVFNG
jgi:hypothetical protein